jgi:hypothetical protein
MRLMIFSNIYPSGAFFRSALPIDEYGNKSIFRRWRGIALASVFGPHLLRSQANVKVEFDAVFTLKRCSFDIAC